jgi:hypothetical protein
MTRFVLTLLCVIGCYTATNYSAPRTAETFGPWSDPVNAGPQLNTTSNDNYAVLSRDELTIYFTSDRPGGHGLDDLWSATRESVDEAWGVPVNMGDLINTQVADSLSVLSSNEHVMYFHSTRDGCGLGDIWMTRRRNRHSVWGAPTNLGCELDNPNTSAVEIAPAFFEDPEMDQAWLYYGSNRGGGNFDVYRSPLEEDGTAGAGMLVPEFSSIGRDTRIFIRKDGLEVFITSDRTGGQGLIDIWTSTRETLSDPWPTPIDVPGPVNSACDDGSPWLSRDGTTLYFFSSRTLGTECGKRDIWYVKRSKTDDAK